MLQIFNEFDWIMHMDMGILDGVEKKNNFLLKYNK